MNRAETGASIAPTLFKWHIASWTAAATCTICLFTAVAILFPPLIPRPVHVTPSDYVVLVALFVVCAAVSIRAFLYEAQLKREITESWMRLYGETMWRLPSGEVGTVKDVSLTGSTLHLAFPVGDRRSYAFQDLTPVDSGDVADLTGLDDNLMAKVDFVERNNGMVAVVVCSFWVIHSVVAYGLSGVPKGFGLGFVFPAVVVTGYVLPVLILTCRDLSHSIISEYTTNLSQSRWRSLDGKVGTIRWADRADKGGSDSDRLVLAFPDGKVREFRREDVMPVAFETSYSL